jgi:hypothetical protein
VSAAATGTIVWAALAAALVGWLVLSALLRSVTIVSVVRWFLTCWLGRALLLAGWAAAGWHVFCQRP